jgi:outer membrane murein-binding lipoprotein Lpp
MIPKAARMLVTCILGSLPFSVAAEEDLRALVEELSAQVKQLTSRVNELEEELAKERESRRQAVKPITEPARTTPVETAASGTDKSPVEDGSSALDHEPEPVTVGDVKGSYKIPGTDTSLAIGGYAKLDAIFNSVSAGAGRTADQFLIPSTIPVGLSARGEHGQTTFSARESRLWLKSFTPTEWGDLNTYLEIDFYAQDTIDERTTNSHSPRLRHGYGILGNFLAGQTWSTFMNVGALPELNDFGGPVGQIIVRHPQVRWTQPIWIAGTPFEIQAALELPETTLTLPDGTRLTPDDDRSPDIVARLNYNPDWGTLSIAGLARQIRVSDPDENRESEAWGGAVSLAGRIRTFGLDNFRFMLNYGNVLGRYVSYNLFNDGALSTGGRIDLLNVYGGFAAYQHWWSPNWRSTVAYGFAQADYPGFVAQSVSRQAQSVHVNLLWSPLLQTTIGLEYIYALREVASGEHGDLQRVQFSTRFNF